MSVVLGQYLSFDEMAKTIIKRANARLKFLCTKHDYKALYSNCSLLWSSCFAILAGFLLYHKDYMAENSDHPGLT